MQLRIKKPNLIIDLNAIVNNWRKLAASAPTSKPSAVVKANAYGLGLTRIAEALIEAGCDTFFVATLAEAMEFRDSFGQQSKVFVFSGCQNGEYSTFIDRDITPVLNSLPQIHQWQEFAKGVSCAIMLDTGMNRLGLSSDELRRYLSEHGAILNVEYLLSHLACADDPKDDKNAQQLKEFQTALMDVKNLYPSVQASLSNSAGIYLDPNYHFDLIRPGIAIYGGFPDPYTALEDLESVVKLSLPIVQIRQLFTEQSVGYGAAEIVPEDTYLATVQAGYADGVFRCGQGKLRGLLCGISVPLVGRVSMDYCVFDITAVIRSGLSVSELECNGCIELIGESQTINDMARMENTISYEVLTSLSSRYHKTYQATS